MLGSLSRSHSNQIQPPGSWSLGPSSHPGSWLKQGKGGTVLYRNEATRVGTGLSCTPPHTHTQLRVPEGARGGLKSPDL